MAISAKDFGRYADDVQETNGEYTLPIGDDFEIHPGAASGWAVVAWRKGAVLCNFASLDDAVAYAQEKAYSEQLRRLNNDLGPIS